MGNFFPFWINISRNILIFYLILVVTTGISFLLSSISAVLIFSGMQMFKWWFNSSQFHTLVGGYLGSLLFVLFLTAIGNIETCLFGKAFQVKLFPEGKLHIILYNKVLSYFSSWSRSIYWLSIFLSVLFCFLIALFASATIHRICGTSWWVFLYFCNWFKH